MKPLRGRSMSAVLDFLREVYAQQDMDGFVDTVVRGLPHLIAADMASFNEVDPHTGRFRTVVAPAGADSFPGGDEVFERHFPAHPYILNIRRFEDGKAHALSEFISHTDFLGSAIYNEYYRHTGTESQLAIALPWTPPFVRGIALNRGRRDFSARERDILTVLAPHLVQAYRNAEALQRARGAEAAASTTDAEVVLLSGGGSVDFATPRARRWLASYFGGSSTRDGRLPRTLADWLCLQASAVDGSRPPLRQPFVVTRDGGRLEVRLSDRNQQALLVCERQRQVAPRALEALGLSPREAQVLAWVVEGKTNSEIGIILGARPRTVAKHLERIFRKLGVETRTAAAASVLHRPAP